MTQAQHSPTPSHGSSHAAPHAAPHAALSRRHLLTTGAAGTAAATGGLLLSAGAADARSGGGGGGRQGRLPRKVDVVVVGAGISGLVATREMLEQGLDVLCVEARDRVGSDSSFSPTPRSDHTSWWLSEAALTVTVVQPSGATGSAAGCSTTSCAPAG